MKKYFKKQLEEMFPGVVFEGDADIGEDVTILDGSHIGKNVRILDDVFISNNATVGRGVVLASGSQVHGGVVIESGSIIGASCHLLRHSIIRDNATLSTNSVVGSHSVVGPGACLGSGCKIGENSTVVPYGFLPEHSRIGNHRKGVNRAITLIGIGDTQRLTAFLCNDGLIIYIGCMNETKGATPDEARKFIAKKYLDGHPYFDAIDYAEKWAKFVQTGESLRK